MSSKKTSKMFVAVSIIYTIVGLRVANKWVLGKTPCNSCKERVE